MQNQLCPEVQSPKHLTDIRDIGEKASAGYQEEFSGEWLKLYF